MGLLEDLEQAFGTRDLYVGLGVSKNASESEIKKAYHRLALKHHPDKVQSQTGSSMKEEAEKQFQVISGVFAILRDKEKRALYDDTGIVGDLSEEDFEASYDFWRKIYPKIEPQTLLAFKEKYQGSDEELQDLKKAYLQFSGDMGKIIDNVICSNVLDDEDRFVAIIRSLVEIGDLPDFPAFSNEPARKKAARWKKATKEAAEAEAELLHSRTRGNNNSHGHAGPPYEDDGEEAEEASSEEEEFEDDDLDDLDDLDTEFQEEGDQGDEETEQKYKKKNKLNRKSRHQTSSSPASSSREKKKENPADKKKYKQSSSSNSASSRSSRPAVSKKKDSSEPDLVSLLKQRGVERSRGFDAFADKHLSKSKRCKLEEDPFASDSEFERVQQQMLSRHTLQSSSRPKPKPSKKQ